MSRCCLRRWALLSTPHGQDGVTSAALPCAAQPRGPDASPDALVVGYSRCGRCSPVRVAGAYGIDSRAACGVAVDGVAAAHGSATAAAAHRSARRSASSRDGTACGHRSRAHDDKPAVPRGARRRGGAVCRVASTTPTRLPRRRRAAVIVNRAACDSGSKPRVAHRASACGDSACGRRYWSHCAAHYAYRPPNVVCAGPWSR